MPNGLLFKASANTSCTSPQDNGLPERKRKFYMGIMGLVIEAIFLEKSRPQIGLEKVILYKTVD